MEVIGIVIIILLLILFALFFWDRFQRRQRLKEQGDALSKAVEERIDGRLNIFLDISKGLEVLKEKTKDIQEVGKSISSLQEALRAPKFRGEFGEAGLETLLMNHFSGSYHLQHRFRNGKTVDAVVKVGEKWVPIDSKFPFSLDAFKSMVTTQSQDERHHLKKQFTRTIKKHIDDVSQYIQPDEGTYDFALLYIPAENLYYETVACEESDLNSYCRDKRVFPVSPNTFYVYLQAIVLGLRGLQVEKCAGEILGRLERLKNELNSFEQDYELIGRHITNAARKYTEAEIKLTRFSGNLELLSKEAPVERLAQGSTETQDEGSASE